MAQATTVRARLRDAAGGFTAHRRIIGVLLVLALLIAAGVTWGVSALARNDGREITAYFSSGVGVYPGSELKILGVAVGTVDSIEPQGEKVKVTMTLDDGVQVPADVNAVVISPSVVSGRYVQLTPAYESGPELKAGAKIPVERTATPVEIDELYASITELTDALGPGGANVNGALSDLIDTGAENLKGNGKEMADSIEAFGDATATLSGRSEQLFGTIRNLQSFTTMLKNNDTQVSTAEQQLSDVMGFLAQDKTELAEALRQLGDALGRVETFVKDNRGKLKLNVDRLAQITGKLVENRASFAEFMDVAPLAADNFLKAYDPNSRTIDGRGNLNEISMGGPLFEPTGTEGLAPVSAAEQKSLPPLPLPTVGDVYGTPGSAEKTDGQSTEKKGGGQ
ncbi:hypothetical protein SRB5_62100 [Streptomyces sp. RB5]|uniref:MCE family protein n=1 Tax=Streptomyces smaragdinus TaxID=2585196 RepID=A0A7K0CRA0_9ACTN|nr:MCE family protein [Streptomyces smaragdinus]MQY16018.1 hypothetical protein [Streptomyces smaragdinus]